MPKNKKIAKKKVMKKRIVKRKAVKKKAVKKRAARNKTAVLKKTKETIIGTITHYFPKVRAAVIKLKVPLATGDTVRIKGHTTDFTQNVSSMQIDRIPMASAKKGQEIGLLVDSRVRQNDLVYKP